MTAGASGRATTEALVWLEEQIVALKEAQTSQLLHTEQLQRQIHEVASQANKADSAVRHGYHISTEHQMGMPDKLVSLNEDAEHLRSAIIANKAEIDNSIRTLRAEADNASQARRAMLKQVEVTAAEVATLASTLAQAQAQVIQVGQTVTVILERQAGVERQSEQFGLRLERVSEVTHGLEERIAERVSREQEEQLVPVYERMQLLGEMVRRVEDTITEVASEQTLREDVLQEIAAWRDQHGRIEVRLNDLERTHLRKPLLDPRRTNFMATLAWRKGVTPV